jgi:opacity protein-like surface antigen
MNKKLCITLLALVFVAPIMAQQSAGTRDASFVPQKGQWQVAASFGSNQMFDQQLDYLLPMYFNVVGNGMVNFENPVGFGSNSMQSQDPAAYLNLSELGSNSMFNLIGLQAKYFLTDHLDVNLSFGMNINLTPAKDYIEGDYSVENLPIQSSKYMEGRLANVWNAAVGSNYYFNTRNERINLYVGALVGWQMGRIQTILPYTGIKWSGNDDELVASDLEIYVPNSRAGQLMALKAAVTAGVEYALADGLILGFEVQPINYQYSILQICPKAGMTYTALHHYLGFLATPQMKIGFRF